VDGRLDLSIVQWDQPEHNAALLVHYDNTTETSTEYRFDAVNPFHVEIAHIEDCLTRREQGGPTIVDGYNVDLVIESMAISSRERRPVVLDWEVRE